MTPTPRQREEWEMNRQKFLDSVNKEIETMETIISDVIRERDRIEAMTFEDHYFSYLAERGSER